MRKSSVIQFLLDSQKGLLRKKRLLLSSLYSVADTLPVMNRYCAIDSIVNTDERHVVGDWLISNILYTDESSKN